LVEGLEFVSVACGGLDAPSLRWNHREIKHVFEDVLDTGAIRRYRVEQTFVEHMSRRSL